MPLPFSIAISSMNAATTGLRTTANNIANVNTNGFTQSRVEFASLPNGSGVKVASIVEDPAMTSGVDLTEQLLKMIEYSMQFEAQARVVETANELTKTVTEI